MDEYGNEVRHYEQKPRQGGDGSAGLICGIIGIFVAGLILGVISLTLAKKDKHPTACIVLGIIDIVGWAIVMLLLL